MSRAQRVGAHCGRQAVFNDDGFAVFIVAGYDAADFSVHAETP
jgi:hypothetical protein